MFHGTIGVKPELDEESTSRPSILDKVSERMEESTPTSESDALGAVLDEDGLSTRVEKCSALDMLFGEDVDLSRALLQHDY